MVFQVTNREGGKEQEGRARSKRGHTGRAWSPKRLVPLGRRAPAGRGAGTESCSRAETRDAGEGDALEASSGGGGIADNALGRVGSGMNGL